MQLLPRKVEIGKVYKSAPQNDRNRRGINSCSAEQLKYEDLNSCSLEQQNEMEYKQVFPRTAGIGGVKAAALQNSRNMRSINSCSLEQQELEEYKQLLSITAKI